MHQRSKIHQVPQINSSLPPRAANFQSNLKPRYQDRLLRPSTQLQAVVNYDPPARRKDLSGANTDRSAETRRQNGQKSAEANVSRYVPLNEAQEIIKRAVNASAPEPARILPFCETGAQVQTFHTGLSSPQHAC